MRQYGPPVQKQRSNTVASPASALKAAGGSGGSLSFLRMSTRTANGNEVFVSELASGLTRCLVCSCLLQCDAHLYGWCWICVGIMRTG